MNRKAYVVCVRMSKVMLKNSTTVTDRNGKSRTLIRKRTMAY